MQVRASKHNADESLRTRRCQEARLNIWNSYHCSMTMFGMMMLILLMMILVMLVLVMIICDRFESGSN